MLGQGSPGSERSPQQQRKQLTVRRAFIIEDVREACSALRDRHYICDRITHNELMTHLGTTYTGNVLSGDYDLLWISTPADWYTRTPGKRMGPHWQNIQLLMTKARALRMHIVLYGPQGTSGI